MDPAATPREEESRVRTVTPDESVQTGTMSDEHQTPPATTTTHSPATEPSTPATTIRRSSQTPLSSPSDLEQEASAGRFRLRFGDLGENLIPRLKQFIADPKFENQISIDIKDLNVNL